MELRRQSKALVAMRRFKLSRFARIQSRPRREAHRLSRKAGLVAPVGSTPSVNYDHFETAIDYSGGFADWFATRRSERRLFVENAITQLDELKGAHFLSVEKAITIADMILRHEFRFLGTGVFVPKAQQRMDASRDYDYQPINWFLDPIRNLEFPKSVPFDEWELYSMRPQNADIKYPWELSRCNHFLPLGQAYVLTEDPAYAQEIVDEIKDFMTSNPVGIGINWTCTMDVALRAANWALGVALIKDCDKVSLEDWHFVYESLHKTGLFILNNLEDKYEVTSNHFLANVVGLHFVAAELAGIEGTQTWDNFARFCLEREVNVQILPDGADYESSVHYHRLVLELFLSSLRLSQFQSRPLSEAYSERLKLAVSYLGNVLDPSGRMPVVGDSDDGRFMIASDYHAWDPKSGTHILAPAGLALGMDEWVEFAQDISPELVPWESVWWGFPLCVLPDHRTVNVRKSAHFFLESGCMVSRDMARGNYLLVTNGIVGTRGFGNHKHNDLLSFEYHDRGLPLIVDPGSYVYTSDFDTRNLMRSTQSHNTLQVNEYEQNSYNPDWLFRMFSAAMPQHEYCGYDGNQMSYIGSYSGLDGIEPKDFTHRRHFQHQQDTGNLIIKDEVHCAPGFTLTWNFHFDFGVEVLLGKEYGTVEIKRDSLHWRMEWIQPGMTASLSNVLISPSYGVARTGTRLMVQTDNMEELCNFDFTIRSLCDLEDE